MSIVETLFLVGSVGAFCGVGAAIAYGQHQTDSVARGRRDTYDVVPSPVASGDPLSSPAAASAARTSA